MARTRSEKAALLVDLREMLERSKALIFSRYGGLKVSDLSKLRRKLREADAQMLVTKKTLLRIATKDMGLPEVPEEHLPGPIACIFSYSDPLAGAKTTLRFSKDHPLVELLGGIFEGKLLSKEETVTLAMMPSRTELLAAFTSMLRSPLQKFVTLCNIPLTSLARSLEELAKQRSLTTSPA